MSARDWLDEAIPGTGDWLDRAVPDDEPKGAAALRPTYPPPPRPGGGPLEPGLESQGIGPLELLTLAGPTSMAARGAAGLLPRALPAIRSAASGAAAGGAYSALSGLGRLGEEQRPLAEFGAMTAGGAVMNPALERVLGVALKGVGALSKQLRPAAARVPVARPTPPATDALKNLERAVEISGTPDEMARLRLAQKIPSAPAEGLAGAPARQPESIRTHILREQGSTDERYMDIISRLRRGELGGGSPIDDLAPELRKFNALRGALPAEQQKDELLALLRGMPLEQQAQQIRALNRVYAGFLDTPTGKAVVADFDRRAVAAASAGVGPVERVTGLTAPQQPFTGKSAQQHAPSVTDIAEQIRSDPNYLRRLRESGGGRIVTNQETLAKALEVGPMAPGEIAVIKPGVVTNEVEQTRALITENFYHQRWLDAIARGEAEVARDARKMLSLMGPGIQNLRAVGGRTTQAQAMFVQDKVAKAFEELADLQEKGVPFEQVQAAAARIKAQIGRDDAFRRGGERAMNSVRALETYATMAKLTSPVTHAVNSVSNALTFMVMRPAEQLLKAGFQRAAGDRPGARASVEALYGTSAGFVSGARKYLSTLMEDVPDLGKAAEGAPVRFKFPRALRPLDPFRQLAAQDAFWKAIIEDASLHSRAYASATKQGLKGDAAAQRIAGLVNDPPDAWRKAAQDEAKEFTFQEDPDRFLKKVAAFRDIPGMRLIIPFIQTPYNLAKFQFQRSPIGVVSPRNVRGLAAGGEQRAEAAARLSVGVGLATAAWMTVQRGEVTGGYPKEAGERALWDAEGRRPYSLRIGNQWLQYNRFQPIGMYLGQAAAFDEAVRAGDDKGATAIFGKLAGDGARQILDLPFVSGMSSLLDALQDPDRSAERFFSQTATGLIPNIARDVRYQTDPGRREARGIGPSILNMLPGLSQGLPPRVDIFGREQTYDPNRLIRASKVLGRGTEDVLTQALRGAEYVPTRPRTTLTARGAEPVRLVGKDRAAFEKEMGEATARVVREVALGPDFAEMDQETKARILQRVVEQARDAVRSQWKGKRLSKP